MYCLAAELTNFFPCWRSWDFVRTCPAFRVVFSISACFFEGRPKIPAREAGRRGRLFKNCPMPVKFGSLSDHGFDKLPLLMADLGLFSGSLALPATWGELASSSTSSTCTEFFFIFLSLSNTLGSVKSKRHSRSRSFLGSLSAYSAV